MMKIIYITLNDVHEARTISRMLLERNLANSCTWFPITCMYNFEDTIQEEPEVVLMVQTLAGKYDQILAVIKAETDYINCVAEIDVERNSPEFMEWMNRVVH